MTINQRTLMRMPLSRVIAIANYWCVDVYTASLVTRYKHHHEWKREIVKYMLERGIIAQNMKSDFAQWRRI